MDKTFHSANSKFYSVLAVAVIALIVGTIGLVVSLNHAPAATKDQSTIQSSGSYERVEVPMTQKDGMVEYKTEPKR